MTTMTLVQIKATTEGHHHTVNITDALRERASRELVRYMVSREMFCPFTGTILDIRTVVALGTIDDSGIFTPKSVMHPNAWSKVKDNALKHFPELYVWHMPIDVPAPRSLRTIAKEIYELWTPVNYAALPYVEAMLFLDKITDNFMHDDAKGIVIRFLSNASTWRGADARRIKAELKSMTK